MKVKNILIILIIALISIINCKEEKQSDKQNSDEFTMFTEEIGSTQIENIPILENSCNIDKLGDIVPDGRVYLVGTSSMLKIEGWAADIKNNKIPSILVLELIGNKSYSIKINKRVDRPDVAKALNNELLKSGFEENINFVNITPGEYSINIVQYEGLNGIRCKTYDLKIIKD